MNYFFCAYYRGSIFFRASFGPLLYRVSIVPFFVFKNSSPVGMLIENAIRKKHMMMPPNSEHVEVPHLIVP